MLAYSLLSAMFVATWLLTAWNVVSIRWWREMPGLAAWVMLETIQAVPMLFVDAHNAWWTLHGWMPIEILITEAAMLAAFEILAFRNIRWWLLFGAACATLSLPAQLPSIQHTFVSVWGIGIPTWYAMFVVLREWIWIAITAILIGHNLYLIWRPKFLPFGVYRWRWTFAAYALVRAVTGKSWAAEGEADWLLIRAIFRASVTICLLYALTIMYPSLLSLRVRRQDRGRVV